MTDESAYSERLAKFNSRTSYLAECDYLRSQMGIIPHKVLDIGCGCGGMFDYLQAEGVRVYGLDPSRRLLQNLRSENIVLGTAEELPFSDNTFGTVYFMHSLAHMKKPLSALQEAERVLEPGGALYVVTPNSDFEKVIFPIKNALRFLGKHQFDDTVVKHYHPQELARLIEIIFGNVQTRTFGSFGIQRILAESFKES